MRNERIKEMTTKQQELYDIIKGYYERNWRMPTISELVRITGKAKSSIWGMLDRMDRNGIIKVDRWKKRGISLGDSNDEHIYFSENDIKQKKNDTNGSSKSNKYFGSSIWK